MNATTARDYLRQFARNADDSDAYTDADNDRAIQTVADDFIRATQFTKKLSTITLTLSSATLPTLPTNFRPALLLGAPYIASTGNALDKCTYREVIDKIINEALSGEPDRIGFSSHTTGSVYPIPDAAYVITLPWVEPFTTWTPGGSDPGTLNLPDDVLRTILNYGATALLQHNQPEHAYASESWKKYLDFRESQRGGGSLGATVSQRDMLED